MTDSLKTQELVPACMEASQMLRSTRLLLPLIFTIVPALASAQLVKFVPAMYESAFEDSEKDYYAPQSCDTSCCDVIQECCCCPCPSWSASVDYVHMWRKGPDAVSILRNGFAVDSPSVFSANEFDFHGQSGIDAVLAYDNGRGHGAEIRYFWIDEFSDDQGPVQPLPFAAPATFPATNGAYTVPVNTRYESAIQSIEVLGRTTKDAFSFNYGFRYLNLTETLGVDNPLRLPQPNIQFRSQNDLYGFQLGVDGPLWDNGCGLRIGGFAKAGIYYNDIDANSRFFGNQTTIQASGGASQGTAAFVSELGLTGSYDICRNVSLTAGYRFLFLDGVSLAADQVPNTGDLDPFVNNTNVPVNIDSNSLYYHGFNVGLELRR